jgi:hypothetical protein
MAILYPSLEKIELLKVRPEEGELHLLKFLSSYLDDSYEVFFNPFLNGDRPDLVIMRKNYGIMIIEVKDWKLKNYYIDERKKWRLKKNNAYLKSPIDQVLLYKENIYNLHIESLLEKKIKNFKFWTMVCCAVYFHNETENAIKELLEIPFKEDKKYVNFLRHNIDFLGCDTLKGNSIDNLLRKRYIISNEPSFLFNNELYNSFKRYLKPPCHTIEEGEKIDYTDKQKELIISKPREQRIKGVVGSGKTTVLAARAVNACLRTGNKVLKLTYNITLKNYIHDKISKVRENFSWNNFYINNYHNFLTAEMNNFGIEIVIPEDFSSWEEEKKSAYFEDKYYSNINLFIDEESKITKYDTILIDEIQDYKRPWMDIVKKYYLAPGGEYVLFGDEKQNIYNNELENKDIKTNVKFRPSEMKDCFRSDKKIKNIAVNFQKHLFVNKYGIDDLNNQLSFNFEKPSHINYIFLPNENITSLFQFIKDISIKLGERPNDIAALGMTIKLLRQLDCYYRYRTNEKTNAMFETQEVWFKLFLDAFNTVEVVKEGIDLFNKVKNKDDAKSHLAVAMTLKNLSDEFNEEIFSTRLISFFDNHNVKLHKFNDWYDEQSVKKLIKIPKSGVLHESIKNVRDNKKVNFWFNRGTLKLSTIHSFKGWEANTIFLILEPRYQNSDFTFSFDELIYTGLTRSRKNLIILNYGNYEYHNQLEEIFAAEQEV